MYSTVKVEVQAKLPKVFHFNELEDLLINDFRYFQFSPFHLIVVFYLLLDSLSFDS